MWAFVIVGLLVCSKNLRHLLCHIQFAVREICISLPKYHSLISVPSVMVLLIVACAWKLSWWFFLFSRHGNKIEEVSGKYWDFSSIFVVQRPISLSKYHQSWLDVPSWRWYNPDLYRKLYNCQKSNDVLPFSVSSVIILLVLIVSACVIHIWWLLHNQLMDGKQLLLNCLNQRFVNSAY